MHETNLRLARAMIVLELRNSTESRPILEARLAALNLEIEAIRHAD